MAQPTPEQIQAFKDRNQSMLRLGPQANPSGQLFASRRGRGDADAQEGGFYGGGPPPKADAAPVAGKQNLFVGLSTALNQYQQDLVKQKKREIADQYAIEFAPSTLKDASVKRPGPQDASTAPMQNNDSAKKLDMEETQVNRSARTWPVKAGTQIIKVIDDVMRNSSYITDQQNVEITTATDPVTGIQTQTIKPKTGTGNMQWYKISVSVRQLGYDTVIRDHAYKITFLITPYAVAQMTSQYFPDSRYRGVHKSYQYWFTGTNTQILSYEQKYDNAYRLALSGIGADAQKKTKTDYRDQNRYIYMATSDNQAEGAKNYANEPGNNGASFLYDPTSLSTVKLRIVGDPGWMQQGECGLGVSSRTFTFAPFTPDGSINYDSQAVMFDVSFNQPVDYNFSTGIMDTNTLNRLGLPQEHYTYTAIKCKSMFSRGRFEQEIEGKLLIEKQTTPKVSNGRPTTAATVPASTSSREPTRVDDANIGFEDDGSKGSAIVDETGQVSNLRRNEYGDLYDPAGLGVPSPRPAPAPEPPTSSGDIDVFAGLAGTDPGSTSQGPQIMARDDD
jgi:hypothetical protein